MDKTLYVSTTDMKKKYIAGSIVGVISLVMIITVATNPLRKSGPKLQLWLQNKTPIGMTFSEVLHEISTKGWFNPKLQGSDGKTPKIYLRGELGRYWSVPFFTYVTVFWEFGQDNRLNNIRVWKTVDGL